MLAHLAGYDRVAASTQHGAWNALVFLCRAVLKHKFPELGEIEHAKRPQRVPVACTREDVAGVWAHRNGVPQRMASVLSGAGLPVMA